MNTVREHYWRQAEVLQRRSDLVYEMMPILYALIKSTKGDIDIAFENINEGKEITKNRINPRKIIYHSPVSTPPLNKTNDNHNSSEIDQRDRKSPHLSKRFNKEKEEDLNSEKSVDNSEISRRISPESFSADSQDKNNFSSQAVRPLYDISLSARVPPEPRVDFNNIHSLIPNNLVSNPPPMLSIPSIYLYEKLYNLYQFQDIDIRRWQQQYHQHLYYAHKARSPESESKQ